MKTFRIVGFITIFIITLILNLHYVYAQSVTFRFAPPDGYKEMQTTDSTIELYVDGEKKITDTNTSKTEITYRKTANGYKVINKLVSVDAKRNGDKITSPVNDVLTGREVSFNLDNQGNITNIEGYDTLLQEINKVVDPKMQAVFTRILDPELLKQKTTTEWSGRVSDFVGKTVKEGDKWASVSSYRLRNNVLKYLISTNFTKVSPESVSIDFNYTSDKNSAAKILKSLSSEVASKIQITDFNDKEANLSGSGHRVLDPRTMLIKEEQISRSITADVATQDGKVHNTKRTESRIYKFDKL